MAILYKGFMSLRTVLYTLFLCAILWNIGVSAARADSSLFVVDGVNVDVTDQNSAAARQAAFEEAQRKAFDILTKRMVADSENFFLESPELSVISGLIQDYEITDEKISNVRYLGTYKFRFKDKDVRKYFAEQGLGYTDVSSKPVLVLPFYAHGAEPVLWAKNNPWMDAWRGAGDLRGLVPIVVPIGDLDDDGYYDMVVGNRRGGISIFRTPWKSTTTSTGLNPPVASSLECIPNPARNSLRLTGINETGRLQVFGMDGRCWIDDPGFDPSENVDVRSIPSGVYLIHFITSEGNHTGKIIKD